MQRTQRHSTSYSPARPLALDTICDELGVDDERRTGLLAAQADFVAAVDVPFLIRAKKPLPALRRLATGKMKMRRLLRAMLLVLRLADETIARSPRRDDPPTLTSLRSAIAEGTISSEEAAATWVSLLAGGIDTALTLISNAFYVLCTHPDQLDLLRQDPALIDSAIEEVLRFESPARMMGRVAHADIEVGGRLVRRGQSAVAVMAAANRDPEVFADPDRFDITRPAKPPHVAFGLGIHYCPGAALARVETRAALTPLLARLPDHPQPIEVRWRPLYLVRGLDTLRIPLSHLAEARSSQPAR